MTRNILGIISQYKHLIIIVGVGVVIIYILIRGLFYFIVIDRANILFNLGLSAAVNKLENKTIEYFKRTIAINPSHTEAYIGLGLAYWDISSKEKSIKYFCKALTTKSKKKPELIFSILGYIHELLEDP